MATRYPFAEKLQQQGSLACVALAYVHNRDLEHGVFTPDVPSATLTFIRFKGRSYALTAAHVVTGFRQSVRNPADYGFHILHHPGQTLDDTFRQAPMPLIGHQPDVAWCEIDPALPARFGKSAFEFTDIVVPSPVPFAVAAGYPTGEKQWAKISLEEMRLRLRGAFSRAEGISMGDGDQIQFYSELREPSSVPSMSGMSGGPIFWHNDTEYGFLGTVKQCLEATEAEEETLQAGPHVHFLAQRIRYEDFDVWVS